MTAVQLPLREAQHNVNGKLYCNVIMTRWKMKRTSLQYMYFYEDTIKIRQKQRLIFEVHTTSVKVRLLHSHAQKFRKIMFFH